MFPQVAGLGLSEMSRRYAMGSLAEARRLPRRRDPRAAAAFVLRGAADARRRHRHPHRDGRDRHDQAALVDDAVRWPIRPSGCSSGCCTTLVPRQARRELVPPAGRDGSVNRYGPVELGAAPRRRLVGGAAGEVVVDHPIACMNAYPSSARRISSPRRLRSLASALAPGAAELLRARTGSAPDAGRLESPDSAAERALARRAGRAPARVVDHRLDLAAMAHDSASCSRRARRLRGTARRARTRSRRRRHGSASRLRRIVSHDRPAWNPSRESFSNSRTSSPTGTPHSSSW